MDRSISALSRYATDLRFEDLPADAVHETKRRLVDTLGCFLGGFNAEPSRMARAIARRCIGNPPARILGTTEMSTPQEAAFANGVMMRYLDYNDVYFVQSTGHPSDTISAILAMADAVHADGRTVVTATALAYEPYCNLSEVLPRELGWDMCVYGVLAGAVGSAKILGLSEARMAQAISLAITPNLALEQTRIGELSIWKGGAAPNAARNAVFAALLAREGFTGPDEAIEGRWGLWHKVGRYNWAPFGGPGVPFRVTRTHLKNYPAVLHAQSPITAALKLYGQVPIEDIELVAIDSYWVANRYLDRNSPDWNPATRETADHSIPYLVATALIEGQVTEASFDQQHLDDPRLRSLIARTTIRETAEFTAIYPDGCPCRIEIVSKTGARKVASARYFKGHAKNPLSDGEVEAKFRRLANGLLEPQQTDAILSKLWRCEELADIADVLELFIVKRGDHV